jgi:hypothetical protein
MKQPTAFCLILLASLGYAGCIGTPQQAPGTEVRDLDSARIVELAVTAFRAAARVPDTTRFFVLGFTRDTIGFIVALGPVLSPDLVGTGGGGRVRVTRAGKARLLEVFQ